MLIILSDLHLTDGTTSSNVHETAFKEILVPEIIANAKTKGPTEIRIVLLGDIFDLVRTEYWVGTVPQEERPWQGTLSSETGMNTNPKVENHYHAVLDGILASNSGKAFCEVLSSIKTEVLKETHQEVFTKVTYIVGNHDRALNVFPSLRNKITERITNVDGSEFLNVLWAPEYGVVARHGHEWDEHNHGYEFYTKVLNPNARVDRFHKDCYKVQTIGELVTAELMGGLIYRLKRKNISRDLLSRLMDVNNIRPMTDVFLWLEWFGRNTLSRGREEREIILKCLQESLDAVLGTALAKRWDDLINEVSILRGDLTDRLDQLRTYIKGKSFEQLEGSVKLYRFFDGIFGSSKDDYVEGAKQEWVFGLPNEIQYVLYGHTHEARNDCFTGTGNGSVRMYINTGTYLPLIQRAQDDGFSSAYQMTMVFCYRGDEDKNGKNGNTPSIDIWNGIKRKDYRT